MGTSWRVLPIRGARVESFEVGLLETTGGQTCRSHAVAECLKSNGYRGEDVFLGLTAQRAAVGVIEPELEERRDPQALALVLENELPWAAEEFVADSVAYGRQYLGVAVQWGEVKELVQGMEDAGVWVQSISAWSLGRLVQVGPGAQKIDGRTDGTEACAWN